MGGRHEPGGLNQIRNALLRFQQRGRSHDDVIGSVVPRPPNRVTRRQQAAPSEIEAVVNDDDAFGRHAMGHKVAAYAFGHCHDA